MNLSRLKRGTRAIVESVEDVHQSGDGIAQRLRELGFVPGEPVSILAYGPMGAETIAVQVGFTRFALRRNEAARVRVSLSPSPSAHGASESVPSVTSSVQGAPA